MNKDEATQYLLDFINNYNKDSKNMYSSLIDSKKVVNIGEGGFIAKEGDEGVFIYWDGWVGYYNYEFGFFRSIKGLTLNRYKDREWTLDEFKRGIEFWPPKSLGKSKRLYTWADPKNTYDITDLVIPQKKKYFMNWDGNPLNS